MRERTKTIRIEDTEYQIRRFTPAVGSFILAKIMSAGAKAIEQAAENAKAPENTPPQQAEIEMPDPEVIVRALAGGALFGSVLSIDDHKTIQSECMKVCARVEPRNDQDFPMPIVNDKGTWAIAEVRDNMQLVLRLEMETLVFNFVPFFEAGGLKGLLGAQPSRPELISRTA